MSFQAKQGVVAVHSGTVIDDFDLGVSPPADEDLDTFRASIEAVFDELLDHRGRPLHDFPGRHLIGDFFGQEADVSHGRILGRKLKLETRKLKLAPQPDMNGFRFGLSDFLFLPYEFPR
jgi:hypothetical protein